MKISIFKAAQKADVEAIRYHIRRGININGTEPYLDLDEKQTALYLAISSLRDLPTDKAVEKHLEAITLLVTHGATLFMIEVKKFITDTIRRECGVIFDAYSRAPKLLEILKNATINPKYSSIALESFAMLGSPQFVDLLLRKAVPVRNDRNIFERSDEGSTLRLTCVKLGEYVNKPISPVMKKNYVEVIQLLIENGASYFYEFSAGARESMQRYAKGLCEDFPELSPILKNAEELSQHKVIKCIVEQSSLIRDVAKIIAGYSSFYSSGSKSILGESDEKENLSRYQ